MVNLSFGNGITLVYLEQQATRLFAASDNLDCRYLRAFFKKNETLVTQYIQSNLSNLFDTVEDLIALGNETVAFNVTPASYLLCKKLTSVLKELDDRTRIVWFGEMSSRLHKEVLKLTEADGCVKWEPEQTLHTLLNTEIGEWKRVPGIACRMELEQERQSEEMMIIEQIEMIDIYELDQLSGAWDEAINGRQCPIMSVKWADRQGNPSRFSKGLRTHSPERLKQDLNLAMKATKQEMPCFIIEGFDVVEDEWAKEKGLAVLEEVKHMASYQMTVTLESLKLPILKRLVEVGMTRMNIKVSLSIGIVVEEIHECTEYMKDWKQSNEHVNITVTLVKSKEGNEYEDSSYTAEILRKWTMDGLIKLSGIVVESNEIDKILNRTYLPKPLEDFMFEQLDSKSETALLNGYLAYMTGHYPQQVLGGGVKHIGFTNGHWPAKFGNRLGEYTGLNSALLFEQNRVTPDENSDLVYFDQDGIWKQENSRFDQFMGDAMASDYYLSNAHQVNRLGEYDYQLQMNDFLHTIPIYIRQMDYMEAAEKGLAMEESDVEFQMLEINTDDDLNVFLQDVETFSETGTFGHGYEIESYLIDSCRWSGDHYCRAKQLPRLFVDEEAQVSSCRGCSAIGNLSDSLDSLLMNTAVVSDQEQLLRGCSTCEINHSCSKCTFLPGYMNRQQYCDIRRKHTTLHQYMQMIRLFKGLRQFTRALNGISVHDLRVSLQTCTHLIPQSIKKGSEQSVVAENVFLFFVREMPMIYHAATQKMLKLNEPMALILEALMIGADEGELKQVLIERYQVDYEYAESAVSQAIDLFAREGCLQVPVRAS
jgi:hypothetical protein